MNFEKKPRSPRNKTVDLSAAEQTEWLKGCVGADKVSALPCTESAVIIGDTFDILPRLKPDSFDLMIADPPYNLSKDYGGYAFSATDAKSYLDFTRRWLDLALPLLKPGASVYVCCDWRCSNEIATALNERFIVRNRITWQREKGRGAKANWKNSMEDIWFATAGDGYYFDIDAVRQRRRVIAPYRESGAPKDWQEHELGNYRDTCPSNFWDDITVPYWSMPENTPHPTQKPEKLLAKLILASSKPGGIMLDPFLGSGSTAATAQKLGRRCIGIEQNPDYCALARHRVERAKTDPRIQGYEDGVFYERNFKR